MLLNIKLEDEGEIKCIAENEVGSCQTVGELTVVEGLLGEKEYW